MHSSHGILFVHEGDMWQRLWSDMWLEQGWRNVFRIRKWRTRSFRGQFDPLQKRKSRRIWPLFSERAHLTKTVLMFFYLRARQTFRRPLWRGLRGLKKSKTIFSSNRNETNAPAIIRKVKHCIHSTAHCIIIVITHTQSTVANSAISYEHFARNIPTAQKNVYRLQTAGHWIITGLKIVGTIITIVRFTSKYHLL